MSEPAQKCENYTLELFIALKMAYCCCLGLRGNLDFPDFLQKNFYNINYWYNPQQWGQISPAKMNQKMRDPTEQKTESSKRKKPK